MKSSVKKMVFLCARIRVPLRSPWTQSIKSRGYRCVCSLMRPKLLHNFDNFLSACVDNDKKTKEYEIIIGKSPVWKVWMKVLWWLRNNCVLTWPANWVTQSTVVFVYEWDSEGTKDHYIRKELIQKWITRFRIEKNWKIPFKNLEKKGPLFK